MDKKSNGKICENRQSEDLESGKDIASEDSSRANATHRRSLKTRPVRVLVRRLLVMTTIAIVLVALSAVVCIFLGWKSLIQLILVAVVAYVAAGKWKWFYVALMTAPRDIKALYKYIRLLIQIKSWQRKNLTLADIFRHNVQKHPHKTCILFEDQEWNFAQVEEFSNKVANVFKSHGYKRGDVVALLLENRPEFIGLWLGLTKIGVIVPLINTNQRLDSLVHSITIARSQALIFGNDFTGAINDIFEKIESKVSLYQFVTEGKFSEDQKFRDLNQLLSEAAITPPANSEKAEHHDRLVYIYTSGTTGLPKAAVISNSRYIFIAAAIHWLAGFKSSDTFYVPLPLYHTAGGCMSVGQMLIYGATIVIRKKFSASAYFLECAKYKCTIGHYIGEMCRYILAVQPKPTDTQHHLRMIYGNGLRPQIWVQFIERFNIPKVSEFYGATEGNANIVNVDNTVGSIGFISRIIPAVYPISIIKVDPQTGEPIRDARGLCIPCKPNEPGVFIGKIIPNNPSRAFLGYVDEEASKKKVVCDVFRKGDKAFLSGDIIVADEFGNLFFKDRTGDTYRWKGENVSTSEVEAVLSNVISYKDVVVYGVEIRGQEGRAGMAAIYDPDGTLKLTYLAEGTKKALPFYARPIFVRILKKLDMTGTYKLKKNDLQREGFDVTKISDDVYYLDATGAYTLVTPDIYEKINNGIIRV
ncbi:long-chain fatty acid transport protein 4-like isoform X1 [Zophobas morio]|uniref:long-chain fatty acid transport protein 4-like isoform X1 n=1 Tax=Zophobas morio TaxID=2755281 RepID=UPI003083733E